MKRFAAFIAAALVMALPAATPVAANGGLPETERGCLAGTAALCAPAGEMRLGDESAQGDMAARALLGRGCDAGDTASCIALGPMLRDGRGGEADSDALARTGKYLCEAGEGAGCGFLVDALLMLSQEGRATEKMYASARALFIAQCDNDVAEACGQAGRFLAVGAGGPVDATRGYDLMKVACLADEYWACTNLGTFARDGVGYEASDIDARGFFEMGCDGGVAQACTELGIALMQFADGDGDEHWRSEALTVFKAGCEGGDGAGCSNAARQLFVGHGVSKDLSASVHYAMKGCEAQHAEACQMAANMHRMGQGVEADVGRWIELASRACDLGHPLACTTMGATFRDGLDEVAPDAARSAMFFEKSCALGVMVTCKGD